jgi:hypothetical protein
MRKRIVAISLAGLFLALPHAIAARQFDRPGYGGSALLHVAQKGPQPSSANKAAIEERAEFIRRFFASIDDGKVGDALAMMGSELVPDADARAGWTAQFSAIASIEIMDIRPADTGAEGSCHEYRVTLEVHVSPAAAHAPIPYYGREDNPNLRWILLCPGGDRSWLITSIGTGP